MKKIKESLNVNLEYLIFNLTDNIDSLMKTYNINLNDKHIKNFILILKGLKNIDTDLKSKLRYLEDSFRDLSGLING